MNIPQASSPSSSLSICLSTGEKKPKENERAVKRHHYAMYKKSNIQPFTINETGKRKFNILFKL